MPTDEAHDGTGPERDPDPSESESDADDSELDEPEVEGFSMFDGLAGPTLAVNLGGNNPGLPIGRSKAKWNRVAQQVDKHNSNFQKR
jgi:hypothetical protein